MISMTGIIKTRQYSIEYYVAWVATYFSFFLMLPSVLPTDGTKIRFMLVVCAWNMFCASALASRMAVGKLRGSCDHMPLVCFFNVYFWLGHASLAAVTTARLVRCIGWMPTAEALHAFWRISGWYFILSAFIQVSDIAASCYGGKYRNPEYLVAFYGNAAVVASQFVIGNLCRSESFKQFMWRFAASSTSAFARRGRYDYLWRGTGWCIWSIVLYFVIVLLTRTSHTASPSLA